MVTRRNFLKSSAALSALASLPLSVKWSIARAASAEGLVALSDPFLQPKFANLVPDALAPGFLYNVDRRGKLKVSMETAVQQTGLVDANGVPLSTPVFGYGQNGSFSSWPGRTFQVQSGQSLSVRWENKLFDPVTGLPAPHPIRTGADPLLGPNNPAASPVDTNVHWCYSLPGYEGFNIPTDGVPVVPHLHGGHTTDIYDGNPEYFFSPGFGVRGPRWVAKDYVYDNDQPAGNLWYHDHALGITRLNVYAGLAGFYFVRDAEDTGLPDNPLTLPAWPYEKAYAIQDRMFMNTGELFYPTYPGDPSYADFITGEEAVLPELLFPGGGPTALAEFFGDHMVVNGVIWPKENVEPRNYRLRLLNGTDSRFMRLQFRVASTLAATDLNGAGEPLPFYVIGSDQGLCKKAEGVTQLVFEPGSRYDIVVNFKNLEGKRVIMENTFGDAPFGGGDPDPDEDFFPERQTDRVMAFDVVLPFDSNVDDRFNHSYIAHGPRVGDVTNPNAPRKVALFEGKDEFGRLQPLLGTAVASTVTGMNGEFLNGAIAWHEATTENPELGHTEVWEIWNGTGDAHPIHLHLVHFDILDRQEIVWDSNADEDGLIPDGSEPAGDGTYKVMQSTMQHNSVMGNPSTYGIGFRFENPTKTDDFPQMTTAEGYVENAPKDMVTALPGQVTRIKATFDKPGRYVWHCHILSHEDHEMMRVLHVGPGA